MEGQPAPRELWPHEKAAFEAGLLLNVTHVNSPYLWCSAAAVEDDVPHGFVALYRHMGDVELRHLVEKGLLPDTQPYQTIVRGNEGRQYCLSYLRGQKRVDTDPTCVIEFICPQNLVEKWFAKQHKAEKGCISHGLGNKAGKTLPEFNEAIQQGLIKWRVVDVKRLLRKKR